MEGELLKLLRHTKEAGGSASLTFTTRDGKMKAKLEVELDPPAPASPRSTPPPPTTSPALGRGRRRRKGAAAKVKLEKQYNMVTHVETGSKALHLYNTSTKSTIIEVHNGMWPFLTDVSSNNKKEVVLYRTQANHNHLTPRLANEITSNIYKNPIQADLTDWQLYFYPNK